MPRPLNLYDVRFEPRQVRFKARHAAMTIGCALALSVSAAQALQWSARDSERQVGALQQRLQAQLQQLRQRPATSGSGNAAEAPTAEQMTREIAQLQVAEGAHRRTLAALESGVAGSTDGPSAHLVALARHTQTRLWLTGFDISESGRDLELRGRMLDAAALTAYLKGLAHEPQWRGRSVTALQLTPLAAAGAASAPHAQAIEFQLRTSVAGGAEAAR